MGDLINVDFATLSPKPDKPLWPEGVDPGNLISFEEKKKELSDDFPEKNPGFTPEDLQKLEYFSALLDFPGLTSVTINSHFDGVMVPSHLKNKTTLRLNWSYKSSIDDFQFDQWGVRGGLEFGKELFRVELPWNSIWQLCKVDDPTNSLMIWTTKDPETTNEKD